MCGDRPNKAKKRHCCRHIMKNAQSFVHHRIEMVVVAGEGSFLPPKNCRGRSAGQTSTNRRQRTKNTSEVHKSDGALDRRSDPRRSNSRKIKKEFINDRRQVLFGKQISGGQPRFQSLPTFQLPATTAKPIAAHPGCLLPHRCPHTKPFLTHLNGIFRPDQTPSFT